MNRKTIADLGEKVLIERFVRPLFNPDNDPNSIGDDCAAFEPPSGTVVLISTDRVPADLISFRCGVLGSYGLGRYLAVLNFSDIAACGGVPLGLLLNFGLPSDLALSAFEDICQGIITVCKSFGARVIGGDMTLSSEISISATAIGYVERNKMLRRSAAKPGDSIFVSRHLGLTPLALSLCLAPDDFKDFKDEEVDQLRAQFTSLDPMIDLGRKLAQSGHCTSTMDNTDGLWQTLTELARESSKKFILNCDLLSIPTTVQRYAQLKRSDPITVALGPGADFSLVGTLRGEWTTSRARALIDDELTIVGSVEEGEGVYLAEGNLSRPLLIPGWTYFDETAVRTNFRNAPLRAQSI